MMEFGLLFYFVRAGAMRQKLRSWGVFGQWGAMMARRRAVQRQRKITDRELTRPFVAAADFAEVQSPLLRYVGNPLLSAYWWIARKLMW
jgi:hypothetical protein